ncbi:MurR/RpiR family transcriptional regulator [Petrotoga sp. 9PW.55.5.1]|uniref:MurR/RpiR family transcriptional regulator n=1 Tax=Petrotoga sp. 9PW.55.5.1 TaxID=1308979 RepID=UPI001F1ECA3B|nr:MurR/RpiR family transcriptional regulator [Petrotoga sp. 9PW.55.5.1]
MKKLVTSKIKGLYNSLTEKEKLAAQYIIERPGDVIHYSITELSNWAGTSETTIYRVLKKAGYSGYQRFKLELARELSIPALEPKETLDIFDLVFNKTINSLSDIQSQIDKNKINQISDIILKSKKLLFYAVGRSFPVALDASLKFAALGFSTNAYSDPHMQVIVGSNLEKDDTVIAISHSGVIRDTYKSAQVAKEAGAYTIGITAGVNSPLSRIVNTVLYTSAEMPEESEFTVSRIGEMFMIELLYNYVSSKMSLEKKESRISEAMKTKKF